MLNGVLTAGKEHNKLEDRLMEIKTYRGGKN